VHWSTFFRLVRQLTQILPKGDFNAHFTLWSQMSWEYPTSDFKGHHVAFIPVIRGVERGEGPTPDIEVTCADPSPELGTTETAIHTDCGG